MKTAASNNKDNVVFDSHMLDSGAAHYPNDTKGSDKWTGIEVRSLPIESKIRISRAINSSHIKAVQPLQNLINLNAMLGKPGGGARTICKTPMLYRLPLRARGDVADWEELMTGDFDTSGKGKSALIAAAYRNLKAEVYNFIEEQVIATFHDFEKFFDSIHLPTLIQNAIDQEFPILDLALTIMQQMAPRIIQCAGFCSRPIITNNSILAGCKHSVALTRVFFLSGMHSLKIQHPLAPPELYVDDTAMFTHGSNEDSIRNMFTAIAGFVVLTKELHLKLSHKGTIVSKIPQAAKTLQKLL